MLDVSCGLTRPDPWLDAVHPDRMGEQLRRVAPILTAMLRSVRSEHGTVGVMWDYGSLPQMPRTDGEAARFRRGLRKMNQWYMHPYTHVLLLASSLPLGMGEAAVPGGIAVPAVPGDSAAGVTGGVAAAPRAGYSNTRRWDARGWCFFEGCASSLVKHEFCLWDDRFYDHYDRQLQRRGSTVVAVKQDSLDGLRKTLRAGRHAPLSPPAFATLMEQRVAEGSLAFTSTNADMHMVIDLYTAGFIAAFDSYPAVSLGHNIICFFSLNFGTKEEVQHFAETLSYVAQHCTFPHGPVRIDAVGNGFLPATKAALHAAVKDCAGVEELFL